MSDSTRTARLTAEDLALLGRPLLGFLSVAGGSSPPQPRPVWFEATADGTVQLFTETDSLKMRRLAHDPRASLVVAAPVGEREHWVSVAGHTTVTADGADDLAARLVARYWDLGDPVRADLLAAMLRTDLTRVVIHPQRVLRYAA